MRKFDLILLTNGTPYNIFGIESNMHGIIIEIYTNSVSVLFFNPQNIGECSLIKVNKNDFIITEETLPNEIKLELQNNMEKMKSKTNYVFKSAKINLFDKVELVTENKKYTKYGLHKGEIGIVVDNTLADNCVEVDFIYLNENSEFYGDTFSIDINDLKVIK